MSAHRSISVPPRPASTWMPSSSWARSSRQTAELTAYKECIGCAKLVVFCNAPEDNPFMAGAFHGVGEPDCVINVGVSGPGVVRAALAKVDKTLPIDEIADIIKKTAFKITRMGQLVGTEASAPSGRALRHCGPVPGSHPGGGRLRGPYPRGDGAGAAAAPTAPLPPLPCSMTQSRRAASWRPARSAACPAPLSRSSEDAGMIDAVTARRALH